MTYILHFALTWFLLFWRIHLNLRREGYNLNWPHHFYNVFAYLNDLIDTSENEPVKQEAVRLLIAFHASFMALGLITVIQGLLNAGVLGW